MKIINADKFAEQLEEYFDLLTGDGELGACATIQDMLEDQPTVNPYEWICVEDGLPRYNTHVLVSVGEEMFVMCYVGDNIWYDGCTPAPTIEIGITHWMPLPTPPIEKES